jgi:flagellar basal-body rod modification protein FlgD
MSTSIDDISSYLGSSTGVTQIDTGDVMTQEDFLSLLSAELTNQDPTDPMDNKDLVLQLAQFSTLSEMATLNTNMESFISTSTISTLNGMIGRSVTYTVTNEDESTTTATGTVKGLTIGTDGSVTLNVDGVDVSTSQITKVNAPTTTTTTTE